MIPSLTIRSQGNMYAKDAPPTPKDLTTPTIKQDYYTTGRGGTGNMMHNDKEHPEIARESQDVEAPPLRLEEGRHFTGRGMLFAHLFSSCVAVCHTFSGG